MKLTLSSIVLILLSVATAAPTPATAELVDKREANPEPVPEPLKPIRVASYCFSDGKCFPRDWLKSKREANPQPEPEPLKPIRVASYCFSDGKCFPRDWLKPKRDAEPEPEPEAEAAALKPIGFLCYRGDCLPEGHIKRDGTLPLPYEEAIAQFLEEESIVIGS